MGFMDKVAEKTKGIDTEAIGKMGMDKGMEKVTQMLEALNDGLPKIKALGLSVKDFRIGQGLIPDVMIKLAGDINAINPDKIQLIIDEFPDEKILVTTLKALQTASHMKDHLSAMEFKGVEAEILLGLPPSVAVNFME